jgi:hypothetical protein
LNRPEPLRFGKEKGNGNEDADDCNDTYRLRIDRVGRVNLYADRQFNVLLGLGRYGIGNHYRQLNFLVWHGEAK